MATIINSIGKISGKVGDFVYRQRNGKTIICSKPEYRKSDNPSVIARQKRFGLCCKVSKHINKINDLRPFWLKEQTGYGSCFNAIQKRLYPFVGDDYKIDVIHLSPNSVALNGSGFGFTRNDSGFIITFSGSLCKEMNLPQGIKFAKITGVVFCESPFDVNLPQYSLFNIESGLINADYESVQSANLQINESHLLPMESYSENTFHYALVFFDADMNAVVEFSTYRQRL